MTLTDYERQGETWQKIKAHLEQKLAGLRERNDADLDPIETARLRGEIRAVKLMLLLGEAPPAMEADSTNENPA